MGEEIARSHFTKEDFSENKARLTRETEVLREWFERNRFRGARPVGGFEIEAWLVDERGVPAPINESFLKALDSPRVVPELSKFNVEINTPSLRLTARALRDMELDLTRTWEHCNEVAHTLGAELLLIGILPTVRDRDMTLEHMSRMERYRALNEQVLRLRRHQPITLDIRGHDHLRTTHMDVMLEAAATSFQIHLQVSQERSVRDYNAAAILSAPMTAVSANSPFLFGRNLWDETRIPLFEQSVAVTQGAISKRNRVTFGHRYVRESLMECFEENLENFAVLLPELVDEPPEKLCHLRLHNGTIWRWNRPLIGFDSEGNPNLRIEHRVVPAGPSLVDTIANAALFFGLVEACAGARTPPESDLSFEQARANFYAAAREGLRASITWLNGQHGPVRELLLNGLLPLARRGLEKLELARADIDSYLGVIEGRLVTGQNGAAWQRAYVAKHGKEMKGLTCAYRERQRSGAPVHEWTI